MRGWKQIVAAAITVALSVVMAMPVPAQQESEEELDRLRAEIARLERDLERQIDRRDDGEADLKTIETAAARTRAELASVAEAIEAQSARQRRIDADIREATQNLADEQGALGEQIRMSYMTGRQELLKLLLSQEDPADFGRMLVYYDYLNRHRSERISAVALELTRLDELATESVAVVTELEQLRASQLAESQALDRQRAERETLLAELNVAIDSSGSRIERMRQEEAELKAVLARLAEVLKDFPVSSDAPFAEQRGQLSYPVNGRIAADFGDYRTSARRIQRTGVLIEAETGTVVRAVYHGRVILSQWASGMGLLVVLNHGDGYFSLYGHNAVLLTEPGDWVQAGEPIAEVGDTGGQMGTGVHFEITFNGVPVDPADWVR